jgi:hypothetical protein
MTVIAKAKYLGPDDRDRDRGGCCAVIECNGVRFFSLSPGDLEDEKRINEAIEKELAAFDFVGPRK